MGWTPLTREDLEEMIARGLEAMDDVVQVAWRTMRITPQKWQCSPWGDEGGGFWVVAEKDGQVVWYNDIEDGFNTSRFATWGRIDEYTCNQTTFEHFLLGLPEARESEKWPDDAAASRVPLDLQNGGKIVRRQTTYWDLRSTNGTSWRLHFKSKAETRFVESRFSKIEALDAHPMLDQYFEPWAQLYFSGLPSNPAMLIGVLAERVAGASAGWREIDEYLNKSADLRRSFGLLMRAPTTLVNIATAVLNERGLKTSVIEGTGPGRDLRVVTMDRNAIVARGFRFEPKDPA